jgi:hypothetical protein
VNREDDPIHAGDVVELDLQPHGSHLLVRVAERSPMRHFSWAVPRIFVESTQYREYTARRGSRGWQVAKDIRRAAVGSSSTRQRVRR